MFRTCFFSSIFLLMTIAFLPHARAQHLPAGFKVDDKGILHIAELELRPQLYDNNYKTAAYRVDPGFKSLDNVAGEGWSFVGTLKTAGNREVELMHQIQEGSAPHTTDLVIRAQADRAVDAKIFAMTLQLPAEDLAGRSVRIGPQSIELPRVQQDEPHLLRITRGVKRVMIPTSGGELLISGNLAVELLDSRKWGGDYFSLRFRFDPDQGSIDQAELQLRVKYEAEDAESTKAGPFLIEAGEEWGALEWRQGVQPGSVLDLSQLYENEPITEKHRLVVRGDRFEYADRPGQAVRLHGANLVFGAHFLEHKESERLADHLMRMGYNLVRLHHFDRDILDASADNSHTLDDEKFDRFNYLIAQLKKRGIYVSWDIYTAKPFGAEDSVLGRPFGREIKPLMLVDPRARQALIDFANAILLSENPYTGLPLIEDPVLANISTMNEDFIVRMWKEKPDVRKLVLQKYRAWLSKNHPQQTPTEEISPSMVRFLYESAVDAHLELRQALLDQGLDAPISGNNAHGRLVDNVLNDIFDYVDNHFYIDHPKFVETPWRLPYAFTNQSAFDLVAGPIRTRGFTTQRIDMPFSLSEYGHCIPNPHRAELGLFLGGYAAYQDWDMLVRFNWGGNDVEKLIQPGRLERFDVVNDPMSLMAERMINILFRRGDVQAANQHVAYLVDPATASIDKVEDRVPEEYGYLGLLIGTGLVTPQGLEEGQHRDSLAFISSPENARYIEPSQMMIDENSPLIQTLLDRGILNSEQINSTRSFFRSGTGELALNLQSEVMSIHTPRSEGVVLANGSPYREGDGLRVEQTDGPVVVFLASMDEQTIAESSRLLLIHLPEVLNTGLRFRDQEHKIVEDWGDLPLLARRRQSTVSFEATRPGDLQVFAIDITGRRLEEVKTESSAERIQWIADTDASSTGILAYEIVRN